MTKKIIKTISIDEDIWKRARAQGFNISGELQKHLTALTKSDHELIEAISFCKLCEQDKLITQQFKIMPVDEIYDKDGDILCEYYFVCRDCLNKVKQNDKGNFNNVVWKKILGAWEEEQKELATNEDEDIIKRVEAKEICFSKPFSFHIGVYDGLLFDDDEVRYNDIQTFIKDLNDKPLCKINIQKGLITYKLRDYDEVYGAEIKMEENKAK
jgi:hypothetical protein|tara:strand:- start:359 stop:994 length:636 start_codon:yes stop_codon:yes gene_type:complete